MTAHEGVPQSTVYHFTMESKDGNLYPGIVREPNTMVTTDPADPAKFRVPASHPGAWTRRVSLAPIT
jgi:hypothetical protein